MQSDEQLPSFWIEKLQKNREKGVEKRKLLILATKSIDKIKFKDDEDLLQIWFNLIDLERELLQDYPNITEMFKYMGSNRIGVKNYKFYIKWANFENDYNFNDRAKRILLAAIHSKVEPIEKLQSALSAISLPEKENSIPSSKVLEIRKPLQEKPLPLGESSLLSSDPSGSNFKRDSNDTTVSFKSRMRGRGKLGPPARLPRADVEHDILEYGTQQKSFPSPESLNSASPHSLKSSTNSSPLVHAASEKRKPSSLHSSDMENLHVDDDDSSSDSSLENLGRIKDIVIDETQNMDLSQTVTFIAEQTPRAQSTRMEPNKQVIVQEKEFSEKKYITVNGKQYFKSCLIGKGGSCKVFKIIDPTNGQLFALKKVKLRGQDQSVIDGYKNEIILLNKLKNNDRIIHLYGASHDPQSETLLMILEFGEIDLEKMLQKDLETGRITINRIRNYWEQMVQAVQAIHNQNIIHSDLKPANFLLVSGSLKLIDFGIAKAIQNDTTNIHRDHQSGTVNYMSPESIMPHVEMPGASQTLSSGKAYLKQGRASDVWSLGCILYRLVYHHPPFGNMALMVKLVAITNPNHVIPYLDPPMGKEYNQVIPVLKGCLVFEPKKRLTIPQILDHEFLRGDSSSSKSPLSIDVINAILKKGVELNVNAKNIDQVSDVIFKLFTSDSKML